MTAVRSITVLMLGVLASGMLNAAGPGFSFFRNHWGDIIVATDVSEEGKTITPPTREKPVYYLGRSLSARLGTINGDDMPDAKELTALVVQILAKQGYVGAKPGVNDPSLYMVLQWGYMDPRVDNLMWFLGYNPKNDIAAPSFPGTLGPEVFRRGFRSRGIQTIQENASGPIYGIIVSAFEYKTANTDHPVIYWQTRIGLPAAGKTMANALPAMVRAAGTAIGRESDSPVLVDSDDARNGYINLGELKILEVDGSPNPPAATDGAKR